MSTCPFDMCDGSGFVVDEARNTARDCRCRPQRVARARGRALSAVIPKRYRGVSFDRPPISGLDPALLSAVRRYVADIDGALDAGRGLALMGDVGTGKTSVAMLISSAALDAGRTVAIYSLPRLLATIRSTYDSGADMTYMELLERLTAVDLLHIDDIGFERRPTRAGEESGAVETSPWVLEQLYSIVNSRYEDGRAIVYTTNLSDRTALVEQVGERTVSRLFEICGEPLPLFGADLRTEYPLPSPAARAIG